MSSTLEQQDAKQQNVAIATRLQEDITFNQGWLAKSFALLAVVFIAGLLLAESSSPRLQQVPGSFGFGFLIATLSSMMVGFAMELIRATKEQKKLRRKVGSR